MNTRSSIRTCLVAVGTLTLFLSLACGSQKQSRTESAPHASVAAPAAAAASAASGGVAKSQAAAAPAAAGASQGASGGSAVPDASAGVAADLNRKIIRNADLGLVVNDVDGTYSSISSIATGLGGYISGSSLAQTGEKLRGTVTLRVPAETFDQAMSQIKKLGVKVQRENVSSQDVTEEYADLQARVTNLEATAEQLRQLLATIRERTNRAEDILAVYRELTTINGQIEQAKGRMQYLTKLSDLATLSVELIPADKAAAPVVHKGWTPTGTLRDAVDVLGNLGRATLAALIWAAVVAVPVVLVAGVLSLLGLMARRRWVAARRTP
jgi:hypothetical protein